MKVSGALAANGLMDAPQSHADATLFKGIIGAQERMDGNLKRDGLVNPGGPTEQTFSRLAGQGFVKPAPSQPATPAQPATGDAVLNAELRVGNRQNAVAAAEARVKANLSDDNRSDYRKAQDRHRLDKARDDAERAQGRARHEQAEQRRRRPNSKPPPSKSQRLCAATGGSGQKGRECRSDETRRSGGQGSERGVEFLFTSFRCKPESSFTGCSGPRLSPG